MSDVCSYCQAYRDGKLSEEDVIYHDEVYGVLVTEERALFERLMLEINQAGLSWSLILKKANGFRSAYDNFDVDAVANYTEADILRLKSDPSIIRNTLKIKAAIYNAQAIQTLRKNEGGFYAWLDRCYTDSIEDWVKLFKTKFKFIGPEIVKEFLMSIGFYPGVHDRHCHRYEITTASARWRKTN